MSLSNLTVKATYQGDGANDTFAIPYDPIVDDSAETLVYIRDEGEDPITETLKTEGSLNDYTLTGAVLVTDFHTNVVFNAGSIPAADQKVIVIRSLPLTQTLNLVTSFNQAAVNKAFDRIVAMIQQTNEKLNRAPVMRVSNQLGDYVIDEPLADALLVWNAGATGITTGLTTAGLVAAQAAAEAAQAAAEAAQAAAEAAQALAEAAQTGAETAETNAETAQTAAEAAQTAAEAAQAAAEAAALALFSVWVPHAVTNGQSATALTGESWTAADYSSVIYEFEVIRGTTVVSMGRFYVNNLNGTWRVALSPYSGEPHGVTWSLTGTTTQQLNAALNSGAGNGTIKLSRRFVPA